MNIGNISSDKKKLFNIDRRITLQFMKEGSTTLTYISGLADFFTDEKELEAFVKYLKKSLGTNCKYGYDDTNKKVIKWGFNGDHRERITKILESEKGIPKDKIKV